ncbi:Release factor glutamine methyltransferase [bacterium HR21]|nr:Release factor glutamine methyltransferase [bacterium HR21]
MPSSPSSPCRNTTPSNLPSGVSIGELRRTLVRLLQTEGLDSPQRTAELLLCHVLGWSRLELLLRQHEPFPHTARPTLLRLLRRRLRREPLQYVLGETEFFGLPLLLQRGVFIPRPETEVLVEEALAHIPPESGTPFRVLDIGTGSGCIALALAFHRPAATVLGIDIATTALRCARRNARRLGLRNVRFLSLDILRDTPPGAPFQLIVANPPYIPIDLLPQLQPEVRLFEPHEALTDGADGLLFYRRFAELFPSLLAPGGHFLLEVADGMATHVAALFPGATLRIRRDYAGIERVLIGTYASPSTPPSSVP